MVWGSAVGDFIERPMTKFGWRRQVPLKGTFWGVDMTGTLDLLLLHEIESGDGPQIIAELWDNKCKSEGSYYFQTSRGFLAGPEDRAQVSLYSMMEPDASRWYDANKEKRTLAAWLLKRLFGEDQEASREQIELIMENLPDTANDLGDFDKFSSLWSRAQKQNLFDRDGAMTIWYGAMLPAKDTGKPCPHCGKKRARGRGGMMDPWMPASAPKLTLDEIGAMRPFGTETTVAQNAEILSNALSRVRNGESPAAVLGEVPMSCKKAFGGTACPLYCGSVRVCYPAAGRSINEIGLVDLGEV